MWTRFHSCDRLLPEADMKREDLENLEIVHYGHPALRERSMRVGRITSDVRALVERLTQIMREAKGLGLAANQVGIPIGLAVVEVDGEVTPLIDPEITAVKGEECVEEGCLSLPRLYGEVARPAEVVVRARDLSGGRIRLRAEGLLARALCHEIDHLNGRLFVDQADESTLHWLVGTTEEGEPITQPTTLADALKAFTAAWRAKGR
jgi:peptide deformylase